MTHWRLSGFSAAVALLAGLVTATGATDATAAVSLPVVSPTPQVMQPFSRSITLPANAHLVTGPATDASALNQVGALLHTAGVAQFSSSGTPAPDRLDVVVGGSAEGNSAAAAELARLGVAGPTGLPAGGYVLAAGSTANGPVVVLDGVDADGTFHAVQTLRQLIQRRGADHVLPGVEIRDWPSFPVRGGMESFYGNAWPQADALHQIQFLGEHKMNAMLYTVTGDPHALGGLWREPYPPAQLAQFAQLSAAARAEHVDFIYRVDPETIGDPAAGICHSDPADLRALVARYQQLWNIGIHADSVGWDDDAGTFNCAADTARFGADPSPAAAAQAYVVSYVYNNFTRTHPGAELDTVPTEYMGDAPSAYRTRFSQLTPPQAQIFWTGPQVVSTTITRSDLDQASTSFGGRKLLIFDNYPVNDYVVNEQHLGPLIGRDPNLAGAAAGIMANEMREEEPSLISLFTVADYAWNAAAYQPQQSWARSLAQFGGAGAAALRVYAENSLNSRLYRGAISPAQPLIAALINAYTAGQPLTGPATRLTAALHAAADAPATIRATVPDPSFLSESAPWLTKLDDQANAGLAAVAALIALAHKDPGAVRADIAGMNAFVTAGKAIPQYIAEGVYETLTNFATAETKGQ